MPTVLKMIFVATVTVLASMFCLPPPFYRQPGNSPIRTRYGSNSPARNDALPPTSNAKDLAANGGRFMHASATPGRTSVAAPAPTRRHDLSQADEGKATRSVRGCPRDRGRYRRRMQLSQGGMGTSVAGPARTVFGGSPARIRADRWDPPVS